MDPQLLMRFLAALPGLVQGAETLFGAMPGQGQVKKDAVMGGVSSILNAAQNAGVKVDSGPILSTLSTAVDTYVAVHNAAGAFDR